jgi:hypothetical protein
MASGGVYLRGEVFKKGVLGGEVSVDPQWFFIDPTEGESRRSGVGYGARVFLQNEAGRRFLNPRVGIRAYLNNTSGTEFRSLRLDLELSNQIHLMSDLDLLIHLVPSYWHYGWRSSSIRRDYMLDGQIGLSYRVWKRLTLLLNADTSLNFSGPAPAESSSFSYQRVGVGTGLSYSL